MRRSLLSQLWLQVLVAMLLGILVGHFWPGWGERMKPLGDAFIALVRMIIAPVIFCTVVHGIAAMNDMRRVGRVALKAIIYFEVITTLALVIALIAVNVFAPGAGMHADLHTLDAGAVADYTAQAHKQSVIEFLLNIIPTTFIGAFAHPEVLPALFVSILFALALVALGERGRPLVALTDGLSQVFFRIVGFIMWVAPLGAFGSIAFTVGRFGVASLTPLARLLIEFYALSLVFVVVVLGGVAYWAGVSLPRLLRFIRDEIVVVAATTSTETVLPRIMHKLRQLGCEESVVGLVVPTGYSFNLDGTCLYLTTVSVFLAQATDTPLPLSGQLGLIAVLLLTSKGAAGVAGAAFVVLAATLGSLGTIPVASIALVLGIHRLMAEALTFVNLLGNCVATIVVARWEGAVDLPVLFRQVGRR
ncbi:MAG TPA: C4-dicarboxylate transporter DctA [Steroidobacteraceae bacterium]|nr:C4-dicarboxylate transporter DctA [Steroidobacteraceae bacterium]